MSLTDRLLQTLPPDVRVANCADCDQLLTSCWQAFREFGRNGLRLLGTWKTTKSGHRRPVCKGCAAIRANSIPGPGEHRPEGQRVNINRQMRGI